MRLTIHPLVRTLLAGTILGVLVLGVGGRIAMAMITSNSGGTPRFTLGGTMTVVALGGASGLAGSVLAVLSRFAARRFVPRHPWAQHVLLAALLVLVTMRGLRGTAEGSWYFYPLVAVYGIALALLTRRRQRTAQAL